VGGAGHVTPVTGLVLALAWLGGAGTPARPARIAAVHPLHLSTAQLAIEEKALYLRIRMFKDDLEAALAARADVPGFELTPTAAADSLFLSYLGSALALEADGRRLRAAVLSSGEDLEAGQGDARVWWYLLEYPVEAVPGSISIRNSVLYDRFDDQRNVVRVLHAASGKQRTLYFAAPDAEPVTVRFD